MKKFDGHVHCLFKTDLAQSAECYITKFNLTDTKKCCIMCCPSYKDGDILQNLKALYFKDLLSPTTFAYAGLYYENFNDKSDKDFFAEDFYNQVKTYMENGFDGIKLLEGKPSERKKTMVMLSDPVYDKMFTYLEDNQVSITLHNSDPVTYWNLELMDPYQIEKGWYVGDVLPSKDELFYDVIDVMKRHPKLKLSLAHFGFTSDCIEQAKEFLSYENTMLDITPGWEQYYHITQNADEWRELIIKYQDRFKYGTDTENSVFYNDVEVENLVKNKAKCIEEFFTTDKEYRNPRFDVKGLKLDEKICQKILYDNANKEFGEPKPINYQYVVNEINRLEKNLSKQYDLDCIKTIKEHFLKKG